MPAPGPGSVSDRSSSRSSLSSPWGSAPSTPPSPAGPASTLPARSEPPGPCGSSTSPRSAPVHRARSSSAGTRRDRRERRSAGQARRVSRDRQDRQVRQAQPASRRSISRKSPTASPSPPTDTEANVTCPAGKVVGGGFEQQAYDVIVTDSRPEGVNSWHVYAKNTVGNAQPVIVWAICMTTDPSAVIATASHFKVAKKHK